MVFICEEKIWYLTINWIINKLNKMISTINSETIPDSNSSCMNCAYAHQRTVLNK